MDKPKAPDDSRGWSAIEIFLFTNGQEYTPPRKYHLKAEELTWWDSTLGFLARSQFGSLHSNIELYTLDGKKITTPLDLTNDAAYVAVKPPDTFVQTGYEKYLLRASRSWEKRHEKLNNKELAETGNTEENREHTKADLKITGDNTAANEKNIENELCLDTEIEINTITQLMKGNESHQHIETTNNSVNIKIEKPELLQKGKSENNTRSKILEKVYPCSKSKENRHNINKKKTTSFPKNLIKSSNNSKSFTTSSNNTNILKNKIKGIDKSKDEHQSNNSTETAKNITETNKISDQLRKKAVINSPGVSTKDFTEMSDVYKNAVNDRQSVFLDAHRKTALLCNGHNELPRALESIHELGETPKNCLKTNETISQQSANNLSALHIVTQPGTLNINLNIDIKGYNRFKTNEKFHANECKTFTTHMNPEKASQVNVDINLSRETLNIEDEVLLHDQPLEASLAETYNRKIADNKCKVHCQCDVMKPENTPCDFNDTDHYIIVIPTDKFDKLLSGSGQPRRGSDKEIQELIRSYFRVPKSYSEAVTNKKLDNITRHKALISQDAPLELFNSENIMHFKSQGDIKQPKFVDELNKPKSKIENFTQTAWSNLLLQVKCHEDGRYTFNLPPLHLLAQYNLLYYIVFLITYNYYY